MQVPIRGFWSKFVVWSLVAVSVILTGCSNSVEPDDEEQTLSCSSVIVPQHDPLTQAGDIRFVHDPVLTRHNGRYYLFATGHGIPIRYSDDLVHWVAGGTVLSGLPSWASTEVPGVEFPWAPDISFFNGQYHLYYSLSTFGSQRSVIGLATNKTLDPTDPDYAWVDRGKVLESRPGVDDFNAIDPNVVFDDAGNPWLSWGSFWGGIRMRRLDLDTGLLSSVDTQVHALASRPVESAIEAPFIIKRGNYYYLFVSFDSCCQGATSTYKIMVGRSENITGPYVDRDGVSMLLGGGTTVLEGYGRIRGPGHNAVYTEGDLQLLVHHFYDVENQGTSELQIRTLLWAEDGWPLPGEPFRNAPSATGSPDLAGTWGHSIDFQVPFEIQFLPNGRIEGCYGEGTWTLDGDFLTIEWLAEGIPDEFRIIRGVATKDAYVGRMPNGDIVRGYRVSG